MDSYVRVSLPERIQGRGSDILGSFQLRKASNAEPVGFPPIDREGATQGALGKDVVEKPHRSPKNGLDIATHDTSKEDAAMIPPTLGTPGGKDAPIRSGRRESPPPSQAARSWSGS